MRKRREGLREGRERGEKGETTSSRDVAAHMLRLGNKTLLIFSKVMKFLKNGVKVRDSNSRQQQKLI